jgi:stage V sporulation protein G
MGLGETPKLEVRVRLHHDDSGKVELLGFADLTICGAFVIKGVRILKSKGQEGPASFFVGFPSRKAAGAEGDRYLEVAHPVTAEARAAVKDAVLKAYAEETRKSV